MLLTIPFILKLCTSTRYSAKVLFGTSTLLTSGGEYKTLLLRLRLLARSFVFPLMLRDESFEGRLAGVDPENSEMGARDTCHLNRFYLFY